MHFWRTPGPAGAFYDDTGEFWPAILYAKRAGGVLLVSPSGVNEGPELVTLNRHAFSARIRPRAATHARTADEVAMNFYDLPTELFDRVLLVGADFDADFSPEVADGGAS